MKPLDGTYKEPDEQAASERESLLPSMSQATKSDQKVPYAEEDESSVGDVLEHRGGDLYIRHLHVATAL